MKRIAATGMMILMVGALCACGTTAKQTPVASQTINNELEEYTEDGNKITDLTAEIPVETGGITDQEFHYLIDENVRCNYWFACGSLPVDEESSTDGSLRPIDQDYFANYAEFETYVRSIYCKAEADRLLYNYPEEGNPKYVNNDGMLYLDLNYDGAKGYYVDWADYTVTIDVLSEDSCTFTIYTTIEEPSDEPKTEEYTLTETVIKEDGGWRLTELFY